VGDPSGQVHDFEPGILQSGLFWTIPISPLALDAAPGKGSARFRAHQLAVPDYHDFFNALSPAPASRPGHVSFDVRWTGNTPRTKIRDEVFGFRGHFIAGDARISFSVHDDGSDVVYQSDPNGQRTVGAGVGHEHNGVFF
jgi:hypothetical protein